LRFRRAVFLTAFAYASAHAADDSALRVQQALDEGKRSAAAIDPVASRRHYLRAAADPAASAAQRVEAVQALANQDWRFKRDRASAEMHLSTALAAAPDAQSKASVQVQRATMYLDAGEPARAKTEALEAIGTSPGGQESNDARLLYAKAALAEAEQQHSDRPERTQDLVRARQYVDEVLAAQPGRTQAAELQMAIGVLLNDGALVRQAFMNYMLFGDARDVTPPMRPAYDAFTRFSERWRGRPLPEKDRRALAVALGQARFHDLAARIANSVPSPDAELRALIAYDGFLRAVDAINREYYPRIAMGLRDYRASYDAEIEVPARQLLAALGVAPPSSQEPDALQNALLGELRRRFGVEGYFGTTMNFHGLLAGHAIVDERRTIEQHGYSGEFRYVSIDRLISRDFTSWYGTTNVGGWGTATTMYQVRQAYLAGPLTQLAWVTDAASRAKLTDRIARFEREDLARCAQDPYAEPKALPLKLKLQAGERLHRRLLDRHLRGADLGRAFVSEIMEMSVEATVFAHEGRHALDQLHFPAEFKAMDDTERELRAKFSEVLFSRDPRLALTGSIFGGQLDESTGHGRANRRFRVLLVDWMKAHAGEIEGLRRERPLITQVDRLTDQQLKAFASENDRMKPK
jgi:hypothetical protein